MEKSEESTHMPFHPGTQELLIVAALALLLFGGSRLPKVARDVGEAVRELRARPGAEPSASPSAGPAPGP